MTAFTYHFNYELRSGIRNRNLLLMNYLFPLGLYLLFGFFMTGINPFFGALMVPAMVTMAVMAATLLGMPDPLVSAREAGILRSYKVNGLPNANILFMPGLTTLVHMSIVSLVILVSAPLLFDAQPPSNWIAFGTVFLALAFACGGLATLIGVIAPSTRLTVLFSQIIFIPSMLLSGLMVPYELLPATAQRIARLLPATHGMNAFRALAMGMEADFNPWLSLAVLLSGGALAFLLSLRLYRWDTHQNGRRLGNLPALLALVPYAIAFVL